MAKRIKPCPFCGSKAELICFNAEYGTVTIGCTNEDCDITMGKGFFSDEEAIDHWNRRKNKKELPNVLFRYCNDMEHIVIFDNGFVESDECEGYPKLSGLEVLKCMATHGYIELEEEEIINEEED